MNAKDMADMLESVGLSEQFCGTWVRGLQSDDVARVLGADPSSATLHTLHELNAERWRIPGNQPILLIGPAGDTHVLAVEPQSYLGSNPDHLCSLSAAGRQAINIYWTVNLDSGLALARDGAIITAFSLTVPHVDREGTDPGYLDQHVEAAGFAPGQDFDERVAAAFTVVGQLSGATVDNAWFETPQRQYLAARRRPR